MGKQLLKFQRRQIARLVKRCFNGVDWGIQRFASGSIEMKDKNGNDCFYAITSIDKAIKKLNRLLTLLAK